MQEYDDVCNANPGTLWVTEVGAEAESHTTGPRRGRGGGPKWRSVGGVDAKDLGAKGSNRDCAVSCSHAMICGGMLRFVAMCPPRWASRPPCSRREGWGLELHCTPPQRLLSS